MDYEKLLNRGMEKVPKECKSSERFEVPKADVLIQGARTIILNFYDIANALRRDPKHMLRFFLKELATSYEESEKKVIFQGRFPAPLINRKLDAYVKAYVLCPNCCKPDSKIIKVGREEVLKCEACGAKSPLRKLK